MPIKRRTATATIDPDEDIDTKPKARSSKRDDDEDFDVESVVKSGWGAARRAREETTGFLQELKFEKGVTHLIKFLQDEPFAIYKQHWIEGLKSTKRRSFACMGVKYGCPLCLAGDRADNKYAFNVALIEKGEEPVLRALVAGPRLLGVLEEYNDSNNGPLSKHYWTLGRVGKGTTTSYPMQVVKARDLAEDFDVDEDEVTEGLKALTPYPAKAIEITSKKDLRSILAESMGEDVDDDDEDED